MGSLKHNLSLRVSQRQILTPGLVQMVSVLALNKLELKDMINAEIVENPVLEELEDSVPLLDQATGRDEDSVAAAAAAETVPEKKDPFDEIDFGSYFQDYLDPGYRSRAEMEEIERPSFEAFLSKAPNLTDHLMWQVGSLSLTRPVREAAEAVIGNLNEDGYLLASDEELLGLAQAQFEIVPEEKVRGQAKFPLSNPSLGNPAIGGPAFGNSAFSNKSTLTTTIIPDSVTLKGTLRALDPAMHKDMLERVRRTAVNIAEASGATADVEIGGETAYPVTVNNPALTERVLPTLRRVAGEKNVLPTDAKLWAEDFSFYAQTVPGYFVFLGSRPPGEAPELFAPNHSPRFHIDEAVLKLGVRTLANLVVDYTAPAAP